MGEWTNRISTGLIATVVTLLIWTWAAEKTREEQTVTGVVRFVPGEGQSLSVDPSGAVPITVQLKGSRRSIQRIESMLERGAELKLGLGAVPARPGTYSVELASALSALPDIARSDLSIMEVRPDTITVTIGRVVTRSVKIEAAIPLAQISGAVMVEPPAAEVTMPESLAEGASLPRLEAFVDVRTLEPGRRYSVDAPLRLPEGLLAVRSEIRVVPERARVTFTLLSSDRTALIPTVPVQISGPPGDLRNFDVQIEPGHEFLRQVTISGPGDAISQIESGRSRIAAIVHLGADDLARRISSRPISLWLLPPGVTVTRIGASTDTSPSIPLRITERLRTTQPPAEPVPGSRN